MDILDLNNVQKFTSEGKYQITTTLKHFKRTIDKYIEEDDLDLNPDFQRGHVWTVHQQSSYIEFMLRGGIVDPIRFNHPEWMRSFKGQMVCVDGLQRTTAMLKFLSNELEVFGCYTMNQIDNLRPWSINIPIFINDLKTRKEVLQWYIDLNSGGTIHTSEEIQKVYDLINKEE